MINNEKYIRAFQTNTSIRVYQAFSCELAKYSIQNNSFKNNPFFKTTRMTWIKPSFLWMMYRSGWGCKDNQKRILAIDITKSGFDWALEHSCSSHKPSNISREEWEILKRESPVRIQWDPERNILLEPLKFRTIQIGLTGEAIKNYINKWTINIIDITEEVKEIHQLVLQKRYNEAQLLLPHEEIYIPNITHHVSEL